MVFRFCYTLNNTKEKTSKNCLTLIDMKALTLTIKGHVAEEKYYECESLISKMLF